MTKEQIGKEIKELIRSIKTHYTFVEEEDRIPLIELELITSKIRKLYEKSIINNYLHANDENYMSQERARRIGERRSFEKNTFETIVKPVDLPKPPIEIADKAILETEVADERVEEKFHFENQDINELQLRKSSSVTSANLKDLKHLIGINDKFLLINNLFARNDNNYKIVLEKLCFLDSYEESEAYLKLLASQNSWNVESYAYVRFLQIVEKRFK
jgi:hypothetical protein